MLTSREAGSALTHPRSLRTARTRQALREATGGQDLPGSPPLCRRCCSAFRRGPSSLPAHPRHSASTEGHPQGAAQKRRDQQNRAEGPALAEPPAGAAGASDCRPGDGEPLLSAQGRTLGGRDHGPNGVRPAGPGGGAASPGFRWWGWTKLPAATREPREGLRLRRWPGGDPLLELALSPTACTLEPTAHHSEAVLGSSLEAAVAGQGDGVLGGASSVTGTL